MSELAIKHLMRQAQKRRDERAALHEERGDLVLRVEELNSMIWDLNQEISDLDAAIATLQGAAQ